MKVEKILIATGGYLAKETRVEKLVFTDEDEVFLEEFDDFDEYVNETIEDEAAAYQQGFSQVLVLDLDQVDSLVQNLTKALKP